VGYSTVEAFNLGVDRRRPIHAAPGGSLWTGVNGHISRGGDFQKRKAFVAKYQLPADQTFGLAATANDLVVFGSADPASLSIPSGVVYQRLVPPAGTMTRLLDYDLYSGLIYAVARYDTGNTYHFYGGARVTAWDAFSEVGQSVLTHKKKIYSTANSILRFCALGIATDWTGTGSGFINMSNEYSGSEALIALAAYRQQLGIFARRVTQIWETASDPADNAQVQVIAESGAVAPRSVRTYGDIDVFYLASNGIRSLRARDNIDVAGVHDVGTAIDTLVADWVGRLSADEVERAVATVDPIEGRFWLAIGGRIFVFSYFPFAKISAWTWYEPGFTVSDFAVLADRIYARSGDTIYIYGGDDGETYDSCPVEAQLPFLWFGKPGNARQFHGIDVAAEGDWNLSMLTNPNALDEAMHFGDVSGVTYTQDHIGGLGHFYAAAPRMLHEAAGAASISNVTLYYETAEGE
jgi:hypothetical protein